MSACFLHAGQSNLPSICLPSSGWFKSFFIVWILEPGNFSTRRAHFCTFSKLEFGTNLNSFAYHLIYLPAMEGIITLLLNLHTNAWTWLFPFESELFLKFVIVMPVVHLHSKWANPQNTCSLTSSASAC